ncbi:MAG: carbohydrate kinase [Chitinophagaceae bacterium]|nr:carbohydrate kinase [Chitinophagaceae bacterium]MCW5905542.1 carbohydrate kinase [Chitinophagaceae bacterium]
MNYATLFNDIKKIKVAIIGDVMLDTYMWGNVERVSPEAPVPIVALQKKEYRIGGAGNVALNTIALNAATHIFSVIGNDDDANTLIHLLQKQGINTNGIIQSDKRITTNKIRVIARNQQMMRLDTEITNDITIEEEKKLIENIETYITTLNPDVIIFEDYNKGVLTSTVIQTVIQLCKKNKVLTTVDPKRKNFFEYKEVDIFKPNLKEVKEALHILIDDVNKENLQTIHQQLQATLQHHTSLITLSEKGIFYQTNSSAHILPAYIRSIADVSGAGDTVIAVISLIYAATKNIQLSAQIANIAGGLVCEEVGTVAINKENLEKEITILLK